ncbi:MAG: HAD family hydrolase [Anaerolineaceae bacterium]|nr:HAD family hydrolase [Anaerolineaceae bacterium]MCY3934596.1 HAD family hydrolase [Chloroflexota bacterium]MCY4105195.1 HAD family hydrolase [Chloroflexota bacterium]
MSPATAIRAVLFDMDDTLIDWSRVPIDAWQNHERSCLRRVWRWLAQRGPVPAFQLFDEAYFREMYASWRKGKRNWVAPHLADILTHALHAVGIRDERCDREALLAAYGDQPPPGLRTFPDVIPTLQQMRRLDLRLGLITNASQPMSLRDETLRAHGLLEFFPDVRLSAADVGYLKPHRAIFAEALERLGVRAEQALYVGDNLIADIHGAQEAGIFAVWRTRPGVDLASQTTPMFPITPDLTIHSLTELLPTLAERT